MKIRRIDVCGKPGVQVEATLMNVVPVPLVSRSQYGPTHIALIVIDGKIGSADIRCWRQPLSYFVIGETLEVYAKNEDLLAHHNDRWMIDMSSIIH